MRRHMLIYAIICLIIVLSSVSAKEIEVKKVKCYYFNDILKGQAETEVVIHYLYSPDNPFHDHLFLIFTFSEVVVPLDSIRRNELIGYIDKYKEWNIQASNQNVELDKNIGKLELPMAFYFGSELHIDSWAIMKLHFLSHTPKKHQFCMIFDELQSRSNEYISKKPETIYFWWNEIMAIREALTDSTMNKYREIERKKRETEEDFK